ncbi:unnamed protein product [Ixodes persulcatus]
MPSLRIPRPKWHHYPISVRTRPHWIALSEVQKWDHRLPFLVFELTPKKTRFHLMLTATQQVEHEAER